ncbi:MAG TPA: T9SS type A sorting domain-containing protein [Fluviicola sp.]|nr:T9SS type A sorting domain-containing protein [Fluviicola sp.]
MLKNYLSLVLIALFSLTGLQQAKAQCPTITVTASDVCPNYSSICGCESSMLSFTIPGNYNYNGATLHYANGNQIAVAGGSPGNYPSLEQYSTGFMFRNWSIATNPTYYYISFQLDLNGVPMTCNSQPFTINQGNANAVPSFNTHALPLTNGVLTSSFVTTVFYANDPITLDATPSQNVFEYIVDCTPVNSSGTPIGGTVTNWNPLYPSPGSSENYMNLRAWFPNLVNPTGMILNKYYRIRMYGIGCSGNTITYQKIIRVNQAVRPVLPPPSGMITNNGSAAQDEATTPFSVKTESPGINIAPNPNNGTFVLSAEEAHSSAVIVVTSMDGKEVFRREESDFRQLVIDLSNQPKGMYLLMLETATGQALEKVTVL